MALINCSFIKLTLYLFFFFINIQVSANVYYVSSSLGNNQNNGLTPMSPFKSISQLNSMIFNPGDSILFKSGEIFNGMFWVRGSGNPQNPIYIGSYGGTVKPILNGDGYQSCILVYNDDGIIIKNLELTNENTHLDSLGNTKTISGFGGSANTWGSGKNVRFGIKVVTDTDSLNFFVMDSLEIHHVFPTPSVMTHAHKGYGIKFESQSDTSNYDYNLLSNLSVSNCFIHHTGHYGIWIKSIGLNNINDFKNVDIKIKNSIFEETGGSGFVPNKSKDVLVENCVFNHTGSSVDQRMWKRGSGMWPFDCQNVVAQHNYFMNAHGPADSYGAHIDYGNENVVFQYNYSYNNEGGFAEILGDNINCGYRYNISVNDGYREDPNGISWNKKGKIFWISNYCGNNTVRCPNIGTFIYNNTIYLNDSLNPEIYFWPNIGDVHIYNNLIEVSQNGEIIPTLLENDLNDFYISNNLFYDSSRFDLDSDLENNALYANPMLLNSNDLGENNPLAYKIQNNSPAVENGFLINGSNDTLNYLKNNGGLDYFGNSVSHNHPSNIGAFNGEESIDILALKFDELKIFPTITNDIVNISVENYSGSIMTKIYSLDGEFLAVQRGDKLSLNEFNSGIYFCLISYKNKIKSIKVVKL